MGFSIALPLATALGQSFAGQQGRSESEAVSTSDGVSEGWSSGETESWGHSVARGESHGIAQTDSYAETSATSHTAGVSRNIGTGHTDVMRQVFKNNGAFLFSPSGSAQAHAKQQ